MKFRYIYLFIILFAVVITGCESDLDNNISVNKPLNESGAVVTMVSARSDGIINISVDAPAQARSGVWIDLDGDGSRAENGSEDVKLFNVYQEYQLSAGVNSIAVYGDITYLGAASNELTGIDVSKNSFLTTLNVPINKLVTINLTANNALERLDVSGNNIDKLDVSYNIALKSLWVYNNELSSLNVSNNNKLIVLDCSGNSISNLDVSNSADLNSLLAYNNQLTSIDVSKNSKLNRIWLFGNPFSDAIAEGLINSLNRVISGELWITDEPLKENITKVAISKGWDIY